MSGAPAVGAVVLTAIIGVGTGGTGETQAVSDDQKSLFLLTLDRDNGRGSVRSMKGGNTGVLSSLRC